MGRGPRPSRLLDDLDRLGLAATFFCLGRNVRAHPDLVGEILRRGHEVETHGDEHAHHLARSPGWVSRDLDRALDALGACGVRPRWYRPPYGQASAGTVLAGRRRRLGLVLWSAWGREWARADPSAVAGSVERGLGPGAIVLLHDSDVTSPPGSAATARQALEPLAAALERRGLTTVTLDQLVASGP